MDQLDLYDSDFYGDESTVAPLKQRINEFNPNDWIASQQSCPSWPFPQKNRVEHRSKLSNPYEGISYAWQLGETVDDFIARLPPATTDATDSLPWIFICNPYIPRLPVKDGQNRWSKGNEDECPEEKGAKITHVVQGGTARLDILRSFIDNAPAYANSPAIAARDLGRERKQAVEDILNLAYAGRARTGKWLLFCAPHQVDQIWEVIAKATANNELGLAAKVSPRSQLDGPRKDHLICVYTSDFRDKADVGRVLERLRELHLVEPTRQQIYYKPDIFTHLGIASGNPWGLRATIFSSKDSFSS